MSNLDRTTWTDAALLQIGRGGVKSLKIEPLAKQLGVTKGSFYWHFSNRGALLDAALDRWEEVALRGFIDQLETIPAPSERVVELLVGALEPIGIPVERALLAEASREHPVIAPRYRRVSDERLAYVVRLFRALDCDEADAEARALGLYATFLGLLHIDAVHTGLLERTTLEALARRALPR